MKVNNSKCYIDWLKEENDKLEEIEKVIQLIKKGEGQ